MKRCVHVIAALLLCLTVGLHWVALQSVAWTAMVIERSCTTSFRAALATTFDGQHPCKLCQVVEAGKSVGKSAQAPLKVSKLEVFHLVAAVWVHEPRPAPAIRVTAVPTPDTRHEPPLLTPPRTA